MIKQLRLAKRQLIAAISDLSEQITNQQQVNNLIVPESSYQIIPGYVQSFIQHTDSIVKWFLPHSKSRIIEITLPFIYISANLQQIRILSKYILYGRKLRGIRISSKNKYANELPQTLSPSPFLQQYYKQNGIGYCQNQILIGDFYLQLMGYRVALFFQDELLDFTSFKNICEQYKFDVISAMSNIQKIIGKDQNTLKANQQQKEIQLKLKIFSKENKTTVLYAGLKIVPNKRIVYWQKSFIVQDNNLASMPKHILGDKNFIAAVVDIELTLQKKWQTSRKNEEIIEEQNQKYLEKLQINMIFKQIQPLPVAPSLNLQNKKLLSDFYGQKQLIVHNLWYIYKTVNKSSPYVIPFPFSTRRQKLFSYLTNLSQYCNKDINQLVKVYQYKVENSANKYKHRIYDSFQQMLVNNQQDFTELIYVYCEDQEQTKRLRNNQLYSHRICNCQSLIPNSLNQVRQGESNDNEAIKSKKMQNACNFILKERFQTIQQILSYFWNQNFDRGEIQKCFSQILPNKVKKFFKLTPHYLFILQCTPQEIIQEIGQAEIRLKSQDKSKLLLDENQSQQCPPKRLIERIEATRRYKNNVNLLSKCHRCDLRFKKDLLYNCSKCSSMLCFDCIDVLTNHSLFELNEYKCALCLKLCKCIKCEVVSNVEKVIKQKIKEPQIGLKFLECTICQLLDSQYNKIQIECTQCKNMRCYNCAKTQKSFQISKLDDWICKDCKQFNQDINNKIQKLNQIQISVSQNDLNQQIIEESISRSPSPPKQLENNVQQNINSSRNLSDDNSTFKSLLKNNERKFHFEQSQQKDKKSDKQIQDRDIIQQYKRDIPNNMKKFIEKSVESDQRRYKEKKQRKKDRSRSKSKSTSRYKNKSKQKNKNKSSSSYSSSRSYRKLKNHKKKTNKTQGLYEKQKKRKRQKQERKKKQRLSRISSSEQASRIQQNQNKDINKVWNFDKTEQGKQNGRNKSNSSSQHKYIKKQNQNKNSNKLWDFNKKQNDYNQQSQDRIKNDQKFQKRHQNKLKQLPKTNKNSLWNNQKKESQSRQNTTAIRPSGLVFQTNKNKELIPDSQQQSY